MQRTRRILFYFGIIFLFLYYLGGCSIPLPDDGTDPIQVFHIYEFRNDWLLAGGTASVLLSLFLSWKIWQRDKNNRTGSFLDDSGE